MITRKRALEILDLHGIMPADRDIFSREVGVKPEYQLIEVLGWLGYCCPFC